MSSEHSHKELEKFVYDFDRLLYCESKDGIDEIWQRIISDVHEYEESARKKWYYEQTPILNFSIEQSNRPDVIYQCDDFIMGIECFEFDASKKTRKGSKQRQKEIDADTEMNKERDHSTFPNDEFLLLKRVINAEFSMANYYEILKSNFNQHAVHIEEYRQNLTKIANGKSVLLSFFIEDTTAIGNYVVVNGKTEVLDPLRLPYFLGMLASTQGLDYVIIKTTDCYVPSLRIQQVSIPLIKKLLSGCYAPNAKYLQYQYERERHYWKKENE